MKKLILGISLLFAVNVNAAIIEFNETTSTRLDAAYQTSGASTHVDVATGLEWLDFGDYSGNDVTYGFSVDNALSAYGSQGFRLANETEVSNLFSFFYSGFVDNGTGTMVVAEDPALDMIQERNSWLVGFGTDTVVENGNIGDTLFSTGMYVDDNGSVQLAGFKIEVDPLVTTTFYSTDFTTGDWGRTTGYNNLGVFMVRDYVPAVPIPPAVWLFGSGIIGLVAVARRKA